MRNSNSLVQNLNLGRSVQYLRRYPLHQEHIEIYIVASETD